MSKPITVSIVGNAGPLRKSLKEADTALGEFGDSIKKIGLAAAAGVGVLAAGIGTAAMAAAEDQKSFALMENAIRNVTGATYDQIKAVDEQIGKMSLQVGIADDKLRPAYAALVRGTRDVEQANKDLSLVVDISTALQMDATTVADALAKGYEGNTKALKSLSPEMAAVIKEGASMSEIMDILSANFSGAATAAAETFQGRIDRVKVAFGEIVEQIGYAVLPMLEKIAGFIADKVIPVVQEFADAFSERGLGGVLDLTVEKFLNFYDESSNMTKAIISGTIALGGFYVALKALTFVQTVTTLVNGMTAAINAATVSTGAFQVTALGMAKVVGVAFAAVAITIDQALADNGMAAKGILRSVVEFANGIISVIEATFNSAVSATNYLIDAMNRIPGVDIDPLSMNKFPRIPVPSDPYVGKGTSNLPRLVVPSVEPINGQPSGTGGVTGTAGMPEVAAPSAGRGGGGGSAAARARAEQPGGIIDQLREDIAQQLIDLGGGAGGGGYGAVMGTAAVLDGLTGGVSTPPTTISITVNTVTADANLPNLIVDALQQYNITSGPIDVAIAA